MEKLKMMKKFDHLEPSEKQKVQKMLREKDGSPSEDSKVDWMYKKDSPEEEEYLLGRKVDHFIEDKSGTQDDLKDFPGALFTVDDDVLTRRADMDMKTKMREDPLYAIKEKEQEAKKRLLSNPIKMKKLEQLVEERKQQMSKKSKKNKKKKKKKKRDSSDDDDDDDLINKYLAIVREKEEKGGRKEREQSPEEKGGRNERERSPEERQHRGRRDQQQKYGLVHLKGDSRGSRRQRSRSPQRKRSPQRRRSRSPRYSSRSPRRRSRSRSPVRHRRHEEPARKRMSAAEMEAKRRAMQDNAVERDREREANVKRYREEAVKEEDSDAMKTNQPGFVRPMMMEHAENTSVEDRIKRNIYNIQRTKADLDKKFTQH